MDGTRVVYHIDEEKTPYLIKIPIPSDQITLGELRTALNKSNFKYFFKLVDDDFGVVKEEIFDNSALLPNFNGRVVCWLVSNDATISKNHTLDHRSSTISKTKEKSRPNSFIESSNSILMDNSIQKSDASRLSTIDSDAVCDTCVYTDDSIYDPGKSYNNDKVMPLRNFGRNIGNNGRLNSNGFSKSTTGRTSGAVLNNNEGIYTAGSLMSSDLESTSFFESEDESSRFSTGTSFVSRKYGRYRQQRRKQRKKLPAISRASSFSSVTESSLSLNIMTVNLNMDKVSFLGISIVGQSNQGNGDGGIYVGSIMKGGAIAQDGRIQPGDMILEVNGISFESMTNDQAVRTLREQVQRPGSITLTVAKCWDNGTLLHSARAPSPLITSNVNNNNVNGNNSNNTSITSNPNSKSVPPPSISTASTSVLTANEGIRPIDPRAWLLHTNASIEQEQEQQQQNSDINALQCNQSVVSNNSQPEAHQFLSAANHNLLAANNNFSPQHQVISLQPQTQLMQHPNSQQIYHPSSSLSVQSDVRHVMTAMLLPDSGLEIKDRLWLKIVLPKAFIGSDLVDWLYRNVYGFTDRRDARKYASLLLRQGFIRHTVNKASFAEQCYYVFGDLSYLYYSGNEDSGIPDEMTSTKIATTFSRLSLEDEVDSVSQIGLHPPIMPTSAFSETGNVINKNTNNNITPHWYQQGVLNTTTGGASSQYSSVASPPLNNSNNVNSQIRSYSNQIRSNNNNGVLNQALMDQIILNNNKNSPSSSCAEEQFQCGGSSCSFGVVTMRVGPSVINNNNNQVNSKTNPNGNQVLPSHIFA